MKKARLRLAAILAGTLNGFFGGGGGMALLPLLSREPNLQGRILFANSIAIMLPISMASLAASLFSAPLPLRQSLPYLAGGTLGAVLGGKFFDRVSTLWLKRLFALFLIYAGIRYLL